jgi:hypothetical protein
VGVFWPNYKKTFIFGKIYPWVNGDIIRCSMWYLYRRHFVDASRWLAAVQDAAVWLELGVTEEGAKRAYTPRGWESLRALTE